MSSFVGLGFFQGLIAAGLSLYTPNITLKGFCVEQLLGGALTCALYHGIAHVAFRAGLIIALPTSLCFSGAAFLICANTALAVGTLYLMKNVWANVDRLYKRVNEKLEQEKIQPDVHQKKQLLEDAYSILCSIQGRCYATLASLVAGISNAEQSENQLREELLTKVNRMISDAS